MLSAVLAHDLNVSYDIYKVRARLVFVCARLVFALPG